MIECRICGAVVREKDLIHIDVDSWKDQPELAGNWHVCPHCLEKLVDADSQRELSDEEEAEILEEERAGREFHRRRDERWAAS